MPVFPKIQDIIEDPLAEKILSGEFKHGDIIKIANDRWQFIEITKETVCMTDSWRNFYKIKDCPESKAYKEMKQVTSFYIIDKDREKFRINLSNLDKLIAFKTKLFADTIKQAARWEPMIEKWKEANKNFLVLNELRKSELKI